jgi:hypothetical protein
MAVLFQHEKVKNRFEGRDGLMRRLESPDGVDAVNVGLRFDRSCAVGCSRQVRVVEHDDHVVLGDMDVCRGWSQWLGGNLLHLRGQDDWRGGEGATKMGEERKLPCE